MLHRLSFFNQASLYLVVSLCSLSMQSSYGAFTSSSSSWSFLPTTKLSSQEGVVSSASCSNQRRRCHPPDVSPRNNNARMMASSSSSGDSGDLSAASRERREEDKRRKARKNEVVPGKTSARPGAKDFDIDPSATEQEYLRQASYNEQEIYRQTEHGMKMLKMFQLDEATKAFDKVFELKPNAYVWHAGIAKFYQNELETAATIFARNAAHYESRFGSPASEERIWRDACELKYISLMPKRKRQQLLQQQLKEDNNNDTTTTKTTTTTLLTPVPSIDNGDADDAFFGGDSMVETRKVLRIARDLFEASLNHDYSTVVLSRAKLRAICGVVDKQGQTRPRPDVKMWKLSSWFFLGLHYDAMGEMEESKDCMKMALLLCPSIGNGGDIIHTLPALHMAIRDWYDDDDDFFNDDDDDDSMNDEENVATASTDFLGGNTHFIDNRKEKSSSKEKKSQEQPKADPVVVDSVRGSIAKLNLQQLQEALRTRGLKPYGSKEELGEKLFHSLMEDAGLDV